MKTLARYASHALLHMQAAAAAAVPAAAGHSTCCSQHGTLTSWHYLFAGVRAESTAAFTEVCALLRFRCSTHSHAHVTRVTRVRMRVHSLQQAQHNGTVSKCTICAPCRREFDKAVVKPFAACQPHGRQRLLELLQSIMIRWAHHDQVGVSTAVCFLDAWQQRAAYSQALQQQKPASSNLHHFALGRGQASHNI